MFSPAQKIGTETQGLGQSAIFSLVRSSLFSQMAFQNGLNVQFITRGLVVFP